MSFVHLHLHSQYSLLDGANRLDDVLGAAKSEGMPAMALTDHGNLFGALEFHDRARKAGVKPILGIEAYVAQGSHVERNPARGSSNHLVLLARNLTGWRNLIQLTTRSYLDGFYYKPRIDHELLRRHSEGLIGLSACLKGEINEKILSREQDEAERTARRYREILGDGNFYLELQDHGIAEQRAANDVLRQMSKRLEIPLVVTNDTHYLRRDDASAHDVLLCIGTQRLRSDPNRMRYASEEFYLKSADEMFERFPDDGDAIDRTLEIAERCDVTLEDRTFHLPEFPVPAGETISSFLEQVAWSGLDERLDQLRRQNPGALERNSEDEYRERLRHELGVIHDMGFEGYFLIVWDFIRHARENGIPVGPGRGSAAGSLVSFALRITDIDPLQYDLLFERFLNPGRISMPDIDTDICQRRRGEVLQYVSEKYGRDRVSQIITFGTLAAKGVLRDVGRVLGLPYAAVDRVAKMLPETEKSLAEAAQTVDSLAAEIERDPQIREVVEIGSRLEGLTRNVSVHAAGVVITPGRIDEIVPLYKTAKDEIVTQWDMKGVERLGLLKMDFLGLKTVTVVDDTLRSLAHLGVDLDLDAVPLDDPETLKIFAEGRTSGIFQFESSGMRGMLRRAQPSRFEELAAFNALYRPGALSVGMVDDYIARKQGRKRVTYVLPELENILRETYGVIAYQEQVMRIAVDIAGFSMAEADVLRKAMGKKNAEAMAKQKEKFLEGAVGKGFARDKAEEIWYYIEPFAGYGFNKSHSVAYAMLAYKTAYLKAHHPVAFMAAMLTSEIASTDDVVKYVNECREMKIAVLPPDVNVSEWAFTVEQGAVRFGLGGVKGLGETAAEAILAVRRRVGRFDSLAQIALEADSRSVNQKVFETLVKSGSCDGFGSHRAALLASLDRILSWAQRRRREQEAGQGSLFAGSRGETAPAVDEAFEVWPEAERLRAEKEALGFFLTGNPLSEFSSQLDRLTTHSTRELRDGHEGATTVGGLVSRLKRIKIKSGPNMGKVMARFVLEDMYGGINVLVFVDALRRFDPILVEDAAVVAKGTVRERGGEVELTLEEVIPLNQAALALVSELRVSLPSDLPRGKLLDLRDLLAEHPGDAVVTLSVRIDGDRDVSIAPENRFKVEYTPELSEAIEALVGPGAVAPLGG